MSATLTPWILILPWHDGLADVSLTYMVKACHDALGDNIKITDPTSSEAIRDRFAEQGDILKLLDVDDILVHPNVTGMVHRHTSGADKFFPKDVRKVCVRDDDKPLSTRVARPLVHHSVKARFDLVAEYRPPALRGVDFDLLLPDGRTESLSGISGLREYRDDRASDDKRSG